MKMTENSNEPRESRTKDAIYDFARNFIKVSFEDLPREAVDAAKMEVLDSLGVALAGSTLRGVPELLELLKEFGGKGQSTVIAADIKLPVIHAAQINATMIHAAEYDDTLEIPLSHPGSVLISTCFAMAEYIGKLSGRECLTAIALGADLMGRWGLAINHKISGDKRGLNLTTLYGYFAAAAIAGRLLGLGEDELINALGIAYHQASGFGVGVDDGALTKRMGPGFAARGGILAALMAKKGITGPKKIIDGQTGIYNAYHQGAYNRETLLRNLGIVFEGADLTIKPYPCCRATHTFIDATLILVKEHNIKPEQVQEVKVTVGKGGTLLCTPLDVKCNPRTPVDAQFSIPWVVATAIVKRRVGMDNATKEGLKDESIRKISSKIKIVTDPDPVFHPLDPGRVEIITKEGSYKKRVDNPYGGPKNPMTLDDCVNKFYECSTYAVKHIPGKNLDRVVELIKKVEKVDNVVEIMEQIG